MASPQSIYPDAIDGYAQVPLVVDRVTGVDANSVNPLRSAIINIETALGVNPAGLYDTVSERLENISADTAAELDYDNSGTVLTATNVQAAIDELSDLKIISTTISYMVQDDDVIILADATSAPLIIGLPTATGPIRIHRIKKIDVSGNIVTVSPMGGQTVDDQSGGIIINAPYDSYSVVNDGASSWYVL